jgi:hypothetical protein
MFTPAQFLGQIDWADARFEQVAGVITEARAQLAKLRSAVKPTDEGDYTVMAQDLDFALDEWGDRLRAAWR